MIVRLSEEQASFLIVITKERYPEEACGLLFGDLKREEAVVKKITALHNTLRSPTDFQIDPEEFLRALVEAEKEDMHHIGFFHSHPASPTPSATDIRYVRLWPESIWLIISSISHKMAAYQTIGGSLQKLDLKVIDRER